MYNKISELKYSFGRMRLILCLVALVCSSCTESPRGTAMRSVYQACMLFANDNGGVLPSGAGHPLDALRVLHPKYLRSGRELAGLSGDRDLVVSALQNGQPLTPSISSWVYVPGLRTNDEPKIAVLWETKTGMLANGTRIRQQTRPVILLNGDITNVSISDWSAFLKQQEQFLKNRIPKSLSEKG